MEITNLPQPSPPFLPPASPNPVDSQPAVMSHPGILSRTFADLVDILICGYVAAWGVKYSTALFSIEVTSVWVLFLFFLFVIYALYSTFSLGLSATTLGKSIFGIKVLKNSGAEPSLWDAFLREVISKPISILPVGLGYVAGVFDSQGLTWHDNISHTRTVTNNPVTLGVPGDSGKRILLAILVSLLFLLGEATFVLGFLGEILAEDLPINLCYFDPGADYSYGYSTHFDVFAEEGEKSVEGVDKLRHYLEQAYDYSFYLVAPITAKISRANVCFYQLKESFSDSFSAHGGGPFPAFAYFSPQDFTVHFSAEFLDSDIETQKNTIYHETNHFVLELFLQQNGYFQQVPYWFVEGFAELVGNFYGEESRHLPEIKDSVRDNFRRWESLQTYDAINEEFSPADFYWEGFMSVFFLQDKFGQTVFKDIFQEMITNDWDFYTALEQVTQEDLATLQTEFLQWLEN